MQLQDRMGWDWIKIENPRSNRLKIELKSKPKIEWGQKGSRTSIYLGRKTQISKICWKSNNEGWKPQTHGRIPYDRSEG